MEVAVAGAVFAIPTATQVPGASNRLNSLNLRLRLIAQNATQLRKKNNIIYTNG